MELSGRVLVRSRSHNVASGRLKSLAGSSLAEGKKFSALRGFARKSQQIRALITPAVETESLPHEGEAGRPRIRDDFPILDQVLETSGEPLVYLDSAATSQKPRLVLQAMQDYYENYNSNVHRGVHSLAAQATDAYEAAREKVSRFINCPSSRQLIFTRNASESINLVAHSWGGENFHRGDEVILSVAEHHSNIVPWQILAKKTGIKLRFAELTQSESVDVEQVLSFINNRTKLVSLHHVSNALGSIVPLEEIVEKAHRYGAKVLVDACQSVPHMPVDVQALDVDFLAASGHKMCGPTGIGFLYGRKELLENMPPFMGGGEMINEVFLDHSTYAEPPSRFEAGTPAIAEAIGLGAAVDYLTSIGMDNVHKIEEELGTYLYEKLSKVPRVRIYGPPASEGRAALCSFNVKGLHPTDLSAFLDQQHGVAIRTGHHCTQPLHRHLGINASARASLYIYNTKEDIDTFIEGLVDTIDFFTSFSDTEA